MVYRQHLVDAGGIPRNWFTPPEQDMAKLLGKARLRNQYFIYQEDPGYRVDQIDRTGQTHSVVISQDIVDYLYQALEGSRVDAKQAEQVLQAVPESKRLPQACVSSNYKFQS